MNLPDSYRGDDLVHRAGLALSAGTQQAAGSADRLNIRALISVFRRRLLMFSAIVMICLLLGFLLTMKQQKEYRASADVVMNIKQQKVTPDQQSPATDNPPRSEEVDTELEIITSRELSSQVIAELKLDRNADFIAMATRGSRLGSAIAYVLGTPPSQLGPIELEQRLNDVLLNRLQATRIGTAYAMRISYLDPDPVRAAAITNAFASIYSRSRLGMKRVENEKTVALLESRIEKLRRQAQADYKAVQDYRIRHGLLSTDATALTQQEISTYNQQVALARAEAAEDLARLNTARSQLARGSFGDDVGEALSSPVIHSLRTQRATVSARIADLSSRYLNGYPDLVAARSELADIDNQIRAEINRTISGLAAKSQASAERVMSLQGSLGNARSSLERDNSALVGLDDLTRKAQSSQLLYDSYLNRYKEVIAESGTERAEARILSSATVPGVPERPILILNLALGLVIGILIGGAASLASEAAYSGLTTGDDVEQRLGVRYLGGVPLASSVEDGKETPIRRIAARPGSAFAESIRSLLTSIRQSNNSRNQIILVTSALPDEGKTSIAACMARSAALGGERVIVIDCDTVRRSLSRIAPGAGGRPGLREVLQSGVSLDDAVIQDKDTGTSILPITTPFERGERLLEKGNFHRLLAKLRERYELIVLDAAPILPVAETRELAALADNVAVIALWRKTSDVAVRSALRLLPLHAIGDLGVALNRIDMRRQALFGYGDASSFYRKYKEYYLPPHPGRA